MSDFSDKYSHLVQLTKDTLSKKRFIHCTNVAALAVHLAELNGTDTEKAYVAGLLHDIKKEETDEALKSLAILSNMNLCDSEINTPALWHGPAAAYYIKKNLGINDDDILKAVRYHTAANDNMSMLQKIIYLSDLTSADRNYPDVDWYRECVLNDIDSAMYYALKSSIEQTLSKKGFIPECTIRAYNFYTDLFRKNNKCTERKKKK